MSSLLPGQVSRAGYPVFRVVVGFLFACHGAAKLFGILGGADGSGGVVPFGVWPFWWAGVIELVGGTLVAVGLGTRVVALICSGEMAYAYFTVHQGVAALPIQNAGEPAALFSWIFCSSRPPAPALSRSTTSGGDAAPVWRS